LWLRRRGECSCGGGAAKKPALVYALGRIGYDFGSEARRDSFVQGMPANANNPFLLDNVLSFLTENPYEAPSVIWTLNLDATPIYAIQPAGPYAANVYERFARLPARTVARGGGACLYPGVIAGSVRLQSGQVVPMIVPAIRGMYSWATKPLVAHVLGARPKSGEAQAAFDVQSADWGISSVGSTTICAILASRPRIAL
jgi:hypothetical protein